MTDLRHVFIVDTAPIDDSYFSCDRKPLDFGKQIFIL